MDDRYGRDDPAGLWETKFARRRIEMYAPEDERLEYTSGDKASLIKAFCEARKSKHGVDPPESLWFSALRCFMGLAQSNVIDFSTPFHNDTLQALVDERQDVVSDERFTRSWNSGDRGYLDYPPPGKIKHSRAMNLSDLASVLSEEVQATPS